MKQYLEIYNPTKTYVLPNMQIATPEHIQSNYAMVNVDTCVITTDVGHKMFCAIEFIDAMRDRLGVDPNLSDNEAIAVMETIVNTSETLEPSAEERIASAMEYQNLFL